jgi:hypothetical protein
LIGIGIEALVDEYAVAVVSRFLLQGEGNQIAEAVQAFVECVLHWDEAVIGLKCQLMVLVHSISDYAAPQFPRNGRGDVLREENPEVDAHARPGALNRHADALLSASLPD